MIRENEPFEGSTNVTQEEIDEARENLEDDSEPLKLIERLWGEVVILRGILEKEIY